jgi:hypothetical protein
MKFAVIKNKKEIRQKIKPAFENCFSVWSSSSSALLAGPHQAERLNPIIPKQANPMAKNIIPIQFKSSILHLPAY